MQINAPVSVAELFDKISILEIKVASIPDAQRSAPAAHELSVLLKVLATHGLAEFLQTDLYRDLKQVNQAIWDVCDLRRRFERDKRFDQAFVEQSRLEYKTNDRRAAIKAEINRMFVSDIVEVKSYDQLSHEDSA